MGLRQNLRPCGQGVDKDGYCTLPALVEAFGNRRQTDTPVWKIALYAAQAMTRSLCGAFGDRERRADRDQQKYYTEFEWIHPGANPKENAFYASLGSNVAIINGNGAKHLHHKPAIAVEVGNLNHCGAKLTLDNVTGGQAAELVPVDVGFPF